MWTAAFWRGAVERMVRAAAAVLISLWSSDIVFDALEVDWRQAAGVALGAALVSLLMSLAAVGLGPAGSASAVFDRPNDPQQ